MIAEKLRNPSRDSSDQETSSKQSKKSKEENSISEN